MVIRVLGPVHPRIPRTLAAAVLGLAVLAGCSSGTAEKDTAPASAATPPATSATPAATGEPCFNPEGGACLGPLQPGTYRTTVFQPALSYTVPEGWVNAEDLIGNVLLYRKDDPQEGFVGGSYMGIYADVRAPEGCQETTADGVGHTPADLVAWLARQPGLATSRPQPVQVAGQEGLVVDVPLKKGWRQPCPWSEGRPVVPVIIGSGVSQLLHASLHEIDVRLLLLPWRDTNVTIEITSAKSQHSRQEYLRMVEPIIRSLRFRDR